MGVKLIEIHASAVGCEVFLYNRAVAQHLRDDKNRQDFADELLELSKKVRQAKHPFLKEGKHE